MNLQSDILILPSNRFIYQRNIQNDKMRDGSTKFTSITNINKTNINSK